MQPIKYVHTHDYTAIIKADASQMKTALNTYYLKCHLGQQPPQQLIDHLTNHLAVLDPAAKTGIFNKSLDIFDDNTFDEWRKSLVRAYFPKPRTCTPKNMHFITAFAFNLFGFLRGSIPITDPVSLKDPSDEAEKAELEIDVRHSHNDNSSSVTPDNASELRKEPSKTRIAPLSNIPQELYEVSYPASPITPASPTTPNSSAQSANIDNYYCLPSRLRERLDNTNIDIYKIRNLEKFQKSMHRFYNDALACYKSLNFMLKPQGLAILDHAIFSGINKSINELEALKAEIKSYKLMVMQGKYAVLLEAIDESLTVQDEKKRLFKMYCSIQKSVRTNTKDLTRLGIFTIQSFFKKYAAELTEDLKTRIDLEVSYLMQVYHAE